MANIEPLTAVDAAWLRMEDSTNLMMVSGFLTFEGTIDGERLRAVLEHRLLKFDRFRMRVVNPRLPLAPAYWEFDPNFDLDAHIHKIALPAPGDKAALQDLASDLMSTPLDFSKPLWMAHIIENYNGGSAVFMRLHHCIADGMALVFVLLSMTDFGPETNLPAASNSENQPKSRRGLLGGSLTSMLKQTGGVMDNMRSVTGRMFAETRTTLEQPSNALKVALWGGENAFALGRLVLRSNDPYTIFRGKLGTQKLAAWSKPIPLKEVKAMKNATGTTVNDVLVSAMTGSLRRYLLARDQKVDGLSFRSAVPINLRSEDEMGTLGNKFGILFLDMPVGISDPLERLNEVHKRMEALKRSKEGKVGLAILGTMGVTPTEFHGVLVEMFGKKLTAVMTNVPGPPMPLYMAGNRINEIMFWVPQSGRVGLGISIISYAGRVLIGVATDSGIIPDPDELIDGLYDELDQIMELVKEADAVAQAETIPPVTLPTKEQIEEANGNLESIKGIGPAYSSRLENAGIQNLKNLSNMPADQLAEILNISPKKAESILAAVQKSNHI